MTQSVLRSRPHLVRQTLQDAEMMAEALDGVWARLDAIVQSAM